LTASGAMGIVRAGTMLERIEIENLGSVQKTSLSLSPLTALLGANASGKTTVMRGIELFAALCSLPLQDITFAGHAMSSKDWPLLVHGGDQTKQLFFRAFVQDGSDQPDYEIQLGINWDRMGAALWDPLSEGTPAPEFLAERLRDPARDWIEAGVGKYRLRQLIVGDDSARRASIASRITRLKEVPHFQAEMSDLISFVERFGTAHYFRPNGAAMLTIAADGKILPTGEGFVAALASLQNRASERFEAIEQQLSRLFPHIRRIRFDIGAEGRIQHLVFETHRSKLLTPANMEAEGVLTTLFLLWAGATMPGEGTLLIDEPEAGLHPHLMGKRVEFLRALAVGEFTGHPLRVVVATQSVDFVRWLAPSEVRVVEYSQETGTLVHAIPESETLRTLVDKFQTNTGDLWYSGTIGGVPGTGA
jgi:predicted ATPase